MLPKEIRDEVAARPEREFGLCAYSRSYGA